MRRIRRGSSRYFFLLLAVLGCLAGLFYGIRSLLSSFKFLNIKRIEIVGNINLEEEFLANLASEFVGQNLYRITGSEVKQKFENIHRIDKIKISRKIPNVLKIRVIERTGLFYLKTGEGDLFPVDKEKLVLENDILYPEENLPVIHTDIPGVDIVIGNIVENPVVDRVFEFHEQIQDEDPEFLSRISEFYIWDNELYLIELNKGYKILFGEGDIPQKYRRFSFIEKNREFHKGEIVDLRFEEKLIVRPEMI